MTADRKTGWFRVIGIAAVTAFFFSGLFSRCGNPGGQPQGGPKDTLPPRVVRMTPPYNSTNISPSRIVIEFNEFVQLKDVQKHFFTSPFLEVKPEVSVKNRSVIIDVKSALDSAATHVFDLGASVVDNNEGNPMTELRYVFSTGDHIDSLFMSGFVSNALTADTVAGSFIFFYDAALDTIPETDSLLFNLWNASAVTRTLSDGGFIFPHLKDMDYRVYAMLDNNSNDMYDPGTDEVAFLDSVYNPLHMPSFLMWRDTVRNHLVAQAQLYFRSFVENVERRQNLSSSARPMSQQVILTFSAPNPTIERMEFRDVPSDRVLVEYARETRDSILYWIDLPQEELPDTLFASLAYERPDSAGMLYLHEQDLRLVWKKPFTAPADSVKKQSATEQTSGFFGRLFGGRKKTENQPKSGDEAAIDETLGEMADSLALGADSLAGALPDSIPASTMKFTFTGDNPVIPGIPPVWEFDLPVVRMDTTGFRFTRKETPKKEEEPVEIEVPFEIVRDSLLIRQFTIRSEWQDGVEYTLFVPPGTIETIDGERNDSISKSFQTAKKTEMGSIALTLVNPPADYEYIVQITDEKGATVQHQVAHLGEGAHQIDYLTKGKIKLRLIEDRNGNGVWDTGILVQRVQPEVIAWFIGDQPGGAIDLQGDVELDDIDLTELFRPRALAEPEPEETVEGSEEAGAAGESVEEGVQLSDSGTEMVTSEARVEGIELLDAKAEKKAAKAARKAARAQRKAERRERKTEDHEHDHDHEHTDESALPGYEVNHLKNEELH